jgi:hypothetical protein
MMMTEDDRPSDPMSKVLAWLGFAALGLAATLNAILGAVALFGGHLIGAIGEVAEKTDSSDVATSAGHAALVAKLIALGFGVLAASEYAAGHFLKRQVRTVFVPIATGLTIVGEAAFDVWSKRFSGLDAVIMACALFATWVWWKLPTPERQLAATA